MAGREGFQQLVAEVGVGRGGIVMGLEVSRLARNNADWHRLLQICALADTLILDEEGIYDPTQFNDRLLLLIEDATLIKNDVIRAHIRFLGRGDPDLAAAPAQGLDGTAPDVR